MIPNILSLLRMPLALFFLQENVAIRCIALLLAAATDYLDGFLARKYKWATPAGKFLDPLADKCFVLSVLTILFFEHRLQLWESAAMLSREAAVFLFGCYLLFTGNLLKWETRTIRSGKIATGLQYAVIFALACQITLPVYVYLIFIPLGIFSFIELVLDRHRIKLKS